MQVAARLPIPAYRAANSRSTPELSPEAVNRLKLLEQWHAMRGEGITAMRPPPSSSSHAHASSAGRPASASAACAASNPNSRRPRNVRRPQREPALVEDGLAQRTAPPWFGKDKIAVLLRRRGWKVSASAVGRIIAEAKRRGVLREPPWPGGSAHEDGHLTHPPLSHMYGTSTFA